MKKLIKREYFHYEDLEEFRNGMWRNAIGDERKTHIRNAANLMRNSDKFIEAMREAVEQWPNSCRHNLSVFGSNRLAWLGHAGCCVRTESPEACTRAAWYHLTEKQRDEANRAAAIVVSEWEGNQETAQRVLL